VLTALKAKAEKALLAEARRHREWRLLKTSPGLGPIRTAELLPVVVTPYRFQSRSHFWSYCGLGIEMRSSSDLVRTPTGQWVKAAVQQTRGLNRNFQPHAEADLQGCGDDGDPTKGKRTGYRGEHPLDFWAGPTGPSPHG
jgi:hypothetical protein